LGDVLTEDNPVSQKGYVKCSGIWTNIVSNTFHETLKTNIEGSLLLWKKPIWEYYNEHPELKVMFGKAMESLSKPEIPGILKAYDFSNFKKIVDVGGSMGHLIKSILQDPRNVNVTGVDFDLPYVVELAKKVCSEEKYDYKNRLEFVGGDYTMEIPKGDAMMVKYCVHNVRGEQMAIDILTTCHKACEPNGKLLLMEIVLSEIGDTGGKWDKCMDIMMLGVMNGKERTLSEFKELGLKCGWKFNSVVPVHDSIYSLHIMEFDKVSVH